MNRLSPLIVRQPRTASRPLFQWESEGVPEEKRPDLIEDVRLFAVGWLGGFIFFGTFLL